MLMIREELEARCAGFRSAYPAEPILAALRRIEGLLQRLPSPHPSGGWLIGNTELTLTDKEKTDARS